MIISFAQAQDKKIVGEWLLTSIEHEDTTLVRGNKYGNRWMIFSSDHTIQHGVYPNQVSASGSWKYDKKNKTLTIVYNEVNNNSTTWSINKLTRKSMIVGEDYPLIIFTKTK